MTSQTSQPDKTKQPGLAPAGDYMSYYEVARIAEEAGFPYEANSASAAASSMTTGGEGKVVLVATVLHETPRGTRTRIFMGYWSPEDAPGVAGAMRRKRAIRVVSVSAVTAPVFTL